MRFTGFPNSNGLSGGNLFRNLSALLKAFGHISQFGKIPQYTHQGNNFQSQGSSTQHKPLSSYNQQMSRASNAQQMSHGQKPAERTEPAEQNLLEKMRQEYFRRLNAEQGQATVQKNEPEGYKSEIKNEIPTNKESKEVINLRKENKELKLENKELQQKFNQIKQILNEI